ncbi:MAG TPA: deoxyguanosinetriphosphate triphosphohydrolase [Aestuariivirgaceae bacterium]|jgi:dGTPase
MSVDGTLKAFAARAAQSRGRFLEEPDSPPRSCFERDRDRIIHSTAFRRLKHKTQVFVYHEGDHYRTRLTHSIEVAQISRAISRALGLNEDLAEALALAHDLGHTPFGHAGENELDHLMQDFGGFDHNAQTLRIVTKLERRYALFDGLNLSWETIEGLMKHNGPVIKRPIPELIATLARERHMDLASWPSAEAQVAALSDDIAYNTHDIDDGLRAKLFDIIDLGDVPLAGDALAEVLSIYPDLERPRLIHETVRRVISWMIGDVVGETEKRIARCKPSSSDAVRALGEPLVGFSAQMNERNRVLQSFLSEHMYRHPKVQAIMARARRVVRDMFKAYMADAKLLPMGWREEGLLNDESRQARQVCDFIAGMTDRYALEQHQQLFDIDPLFR